MSTEFSLRRRPQVAVIAGDKSVAATSVSVGAAYAVLGSGLNISGMVDAVAYLREHANTENGVIKFYLAKSGSVPSTNSGLYQLANTDGTEVEVTVTQNVRTLYPLQGVAAKYLLAYAKGAVGADADLSAFIVGNFMYDKRSQASRILGNETAILASATNLTGSYADLGSAIDIRGKGNITLFVDNSGDQKADIQVYTAFGASAPSATTTMYPLRNAAGTVTTFSTLTGEKAAHPLTNISGDYLFIQGKTTGAGTATVAVSIYASTPGV